MPEKKTALQRKLSSLLKISIFLARLKKPIIPRLVFLRKIRRLKKFKLLKHYNYRYEKEYEFSTSSTPLIQFYRKGQNRRVIFKKLYSNVLLISKCLGRMGSEGKNEKYCLEIGLEPFPVIENYGESRELMLEFSDSCSEDESVDERAERFIQKFYEEMRRQRHESNLLLNAMLEI